MSELLFRLQLPYSQTLADGNSTAYLLFNRGQQVGGGGIGRHVVVVGSSLTTQHLPFLHRALPWSRHSPCTQEHTTQLLSFICRSNDTLLLSCSTNTVQYNNSVSYFLFRYHKTYIFQDKSTTVVVY